MSLLLSPLQACINHETHSSRLRGMGVIRICHRKPPVCPTNGREHLTLDENSKQLNTNECVWEIENKSFMVYSMALPQRSCTRTEERHEKLSHYSQGSKRLFPECESAAIPLDETLRSLTQVNSVKKLQSILIKQKLLVCFVENRCEGSNYSTVTAIGFSRPSQNSKETPVVFHWGKVSLRVTWQPQPMRR